MAVEQHDRVPGPSPAPSRYVTAIARPSSAASLRETHPRTPLARDGLRAPALEVIADERVARAPHLREERDVSAQRGSLATGGQAAREIGRPGIAVAATWNSAMRSSALMGETSPPRLGR